MNKLKVPRNTAREAEQNPLLGLVIAMGAQSGSIEAQEAQGQRDIVHSDTLPSAISPEGRAALEKAGVKFLGPVDEDDIFQYVELPAGWAKKPTDHSMWSTLVDDRGRERASIFYKAAFYDRSAHMHAKHRFNLQTRLDGQERTESVCRVLDCGTVIHETEPVRADTRKIWECDDIAADKASRWLSEHYPRWEDASAYWEEDQNG